MQTKRDNRNDFTKGNMAYDILKLSIPMTIAQIINVLYSLIDRIYIGHLDNDATLALTGLGITFPILMIVIAFANLIGMGGAPLCSIERGRGNDEKAEKILGVSFLLLIILSVILTAGSLLFKYQILYLFGASSETYPFADAYFTPYICGSIFVMIGLGMNSFINSQGFAKIGMTTVMIGAILNIILDPIFIFVLDLGIQGAAIATVIAQFISAFWVMKFLTGKQTIYRLKRKYICFDLAIVKSIISLGMSGFIFSLTNSLVQIVCNNMLFAWGGDIYIGIMTVLNAIRQVLQMPIDGIRAGAQPVIGYNFGAKQYLRVRQGIKFLTGMSLAYNFLAWGVLMLFPHFFIEIFNSETQLISLGVPALAIYFSGFFMMAFQSAGQTTFISLGMGKHATFFSLFRKVILVVPLTLLLPGWGFGVEGVFYAEVISNYVGGAACYLTMLFTVWHKLK